MHSGECFCCSTWPDRRCSPRRDRHLAFSPVSTKLLVIYGVLVFESLVMNRYQRLQVLSSSFRCPHSLCRTVGGQHSPRKPRRGAGRISTPDTKTTDTLVYNKHFNSHVSEFLFLNCLLSSFNLQFQNSSLDHISFNLK